MRLYLVRHGDYSISELTKQDVLNEKGKKEISQLVNFLMPLHVQVSTLLHSGKVRAKQTAELLSKGLVCDQPIQAWPGLNPNDDVITFANEIAYWESDICVVGHLPFMSRLVSYLITGNENKEIVLFHTGTMVCLEALDARRWGIHWIVNPDMLPTSSER